MDPVLGIPDMASLDPSGTPIGGYQMPPISQLGRLADSHALSKYKYHGDTGYGIRISTKDRKSEKLGKSLVY